MAVARRTSRSFGRARLLLSIAPGSGAATSIYFSERLVPSSPAKVGAFSGPPLLGLNGVGWRGVRGVALGRQLAAVAKLFLPRVAGKAVCEQPLFWANCARRVFAHGGVSARRPAGSSTPLALVLVLCLG